MHITLTLASAPAPGLGLSGGGTSPPPSDRYGLAQQLVEIVGAGRCLLRSDFGLIEVLGADLDHALLEGVECRGIHLPLVDMRFQDLVRIVDQHIADRTVRARRNADEAEIGRSEEHTSELQSLMR